MTNAVRLIYTTTTGAEDFGDYPTLSLAREAVSTDMVDWVIVERTECGRYGTVGRVLDSVPE